MIKPNSNQPILSITNSVGVYFLEGLVQNTYDLRINNSSVGIKPLKITADSNPVQEINLQLEERS